MNIQIIVGSIREGRVAIKVAEWLLKEIQKLQIYNDAFNTIGVELNTHSILHELITPRTFWYVHRFFMEVLNNHIDFIHVHDIIPF